LQVYVDKGMKHGQKIVFAGEADEAPEVEAGDIIIVLVEKKHELFKRQGNDLYMEIKLALIEAICGFALTVKHLDNRELLIKSNSGDIVQHGEVRSITGEGMPTYKHPFDKGTLFLQFSVEMPPPGSLNQNQLKSLESILPGRRPPVQETETTEAVTLSAPISLHEQAQQRRQQQQQQGRRGEAYGEDEDEEHGHPGGSRVQCAQQ